MELNKNPQTMGNEVPNFYNTERTSTVVQL
jgi:hypothetical protein